MVGLALEDLEAVVLPVDVVQRECRDLPAAQAVGHEQEQDGVVAPSRTVLLARPVPARSAMYPLRIAAESSRIEAMLILAK